MGGLRKYCRSPGFTSLIGSLALIGTTVLLRLLFQGQHHRGGRYSHLPGSGFAYFAVLAGVFVTAFIPSACTSSCSTARAVGQGYAKAHHKDHHDAS